LAVHLGSTRFLQVAIPPNLSLQPADPRLRVNLHNQA
jgi:hypothetical protein